MSYNAENERPVQNLQGNNYSEAEISESIKTSEAARANKRLFTSPPNAAKTAASDNAYFDSILASCDDILSQLDAAVTKGPKTAVLL